MSTGAHRQVGRVPLREVRAHGCSARVIMLLAFGGNPRDPTTHTTHTHTHTHMSEKFLGDGAMTQPSKFGLTLEIRFDTDRDTMTQTVTPCFAIVPQKAICTKTFGVSYKFCARRLARAFGVHGVWRRAFEWRRASRCRARVWDGS